MTPTKLVSINTEDVLCGNCGGGKIGYFEVNRFRFWICINCGITVGMGLPPGTQRTWTKIERTAVGLSENNEPEEEAMELVQEKP